MSSSEQSVHREWKSQVRDGRVAIQRGYDDMARRARVIRDVEIDQGEQPHPIQGTSSIRQTIA